MAGAVVRVVAEKPPFVVIDGAAQFEVHGLGQVPLGSGFRRIAGQRTFQTATHNLGEAHLIVCRDALGFAKEVFGKLDLGFYHDGNLPT